MLRPLAPWRRAVDAALALAYVGLVALFGAASGALLPGVVFGAALTLRRWSPPLALALAWAGAVLQMALLQIASPLDVATFAVLYACAAYGGRRVRWTAFGSALLGAAVAGTYQAMVLQSAPGARFHLGLVIGVTALVSLLLSWTAGQLVRIRHVALANRRAAEEASHRAAAEHERTRIARDMHDVVAHSLAVVIAQADGARMLGGRDPEAAEEALTTIGATARAALADVRVLLQQLRSEPATAPQPTLADLDDLLGGFRTSGLDVVRTDDGDPHPLPVPLQIAVFRVVQESLTNALRHGAGSVAVVLAWAPGGVEVRIENPLRPGASPAAHGNGVTGMQERAALVGGHLRAGREGGTWRVTAWFPVAAPARTLEGTA